MSKNMTIYLTYDSSHPIPLPSQVHSPRFRNENDFKLCVFQTFILEKKFHPNPDDCQEEV